MIAKAEAKKRVEKLKTEINKYRYAYHVLDRSLISDEALDSLKKELFDLESRYPEFITKDSPTQRVGGKPLSAFKKVRHGTRMISLNDAFSPQDILDWLERLKNYFGPKVNFAKNGFYCDLKMDGLAMELIYEDGLFISGSTRGDGLVGEDVTENLKTIDAIPLKLEEGSGYPRRLIVRGETFLTKKEFARLNREQEKKGGKPYANPRNVAAGSIRQLDPKITASRKLDFYAYDVVTPGYKTKSEEYAELNKYGLKTNPYGIVAKNIEEIFEFHKEVLKMRERLAYEIDGIVISVNDNEKYEEAGIIGKTPRAGIAYKFSPREATTIVEGIEVQVGRTGALTPVAVMRPVNVGGVTITHASLHNADEIERLGVRAGDTVIVSRAGDVIPQVTKVLAEFRTGKEKRFKMPERCPVDGSEVVRDGVAYRCSNKYCGARHREQLYHFISRGGFNLDGLGPKIIDRFLDEGLIVDAADIFTLKQGDVEALPRFGEKSAENVIKEVEAKKSVPLPRFIYSLGIIHVGEETAITLANIYPHTQKTLSFGLSRGDGLKMQKEKSEFSNLGVGVYPEKKSGYLSIPKFVKFYGDLSLERLQEIKDIGPKVAVSIYEWFREKRNIHFLEKLGNAGVGIVLVPPSAKAKKLQDLTFVITGSMDSMSRELAKQKIRELGGDVSESVSSKTSYLVAGAEPGSKYRKAEELGVKILGEKEFLKLIG